MILDLDAERNKKFAIYGIIIVCLGSIVLRFWGLGRFNALIFDEVYYAKFANNYLTNTKFFNSHPPLSQYLIAIGIWIGDQLPIGQDTTNTLTGSLHSTFSYRWMNALFGSFIPPVVAAVAYQLNRRMSYAFLAALFISLDGLFLVDSRYALNNIFLIFFGLLGQLLVLIASKNEQRRSRLLMLGAGISFGASVACKWNGLWFLLGIYLLLALANIWKRITANSNEPSILTNTFLDELATIDLIDIIGTLVIVPIVIYSVLWIPHLIQNPTPNFINVQWAILNYHENVGNSSEIHPYCTSWYDWPLLSRALAYHYDQYKPNYFYDVHAMGNPLLWWLSLASVISFAWIVASNFWLILNRLIDRLIISKVRKLVVEEFNFRSLRDLNINQVSVPLFIAVNYAVNLLPWVKVTRCLFIYHYMGAILFAIMGLAWMVDTGLRSGSRLWQAAGLTTIFGVAGAFVFWAPIYLGLSISKTDLSYRLWDFWIFNWI
jgi:dolichyl-phosphate-mannose-protein mannosyltransferase